MSQPMFRSRFAEVKYDTVVLGGGWDQITPTLQLKPGVLRDVVNFECAPTGGYSRIGGYERFDGRTKPSSATYVIVQVASFTNVPTVGQTLTGNTSGATGVIAAIGVDYMALTKITGAFTNTEVVRVGGTTIGTAVPLTAAITSEQNAQYVNAAADTYRADIQKVPGSGSVLGVTSLTIAGVQTIYAFRANAGATAVDLYKSSTGGWVQVSFMNEVAFTAGGATEPAELTTLTQGGVTARIRRVVDRSGSWAANSAAGRFVIDNQAGGNFAAGAATIGGITVTLSGAQTAITLTPGGKFEFSTGNFAGQSGTQRVYGADGTNRCFEFDGTVFVPITTGATPDTPKHIVVHKSHLIFSISSSLFISATGDPYRWTATDNAVEIATGDQITNLLIQAGDQTTSALAVYMMRNTGVLYGSDSTDWNFVNFNSGTGALDYTAQSMQQSYAMDDIGVVSLSASLAYGNFVQATLSSKIYNYIRDKRSKTSCSSLRRDKSQYRVFFTDGYGLFATIVNGKLLGFTPVVFPTPAVCAWDDMTPVGDEISLFGGSDGYVYELDVGSSFDGANIDAYITFNWNTMVTPRLLKRFRHAAIEIQSSYFANIQFGYALGYALPAKAQPTSTSYDTSFIGLSFWDTFVWDNFTWDGITLAPTEVDMAGSAENVQITIRSSTDYVYPYTVNSIITHYSPRRGLR